MTELDLAIMALKLPRTATRRRWWHEVTLATAQFACGKDIAANLDKASQLIHEAADRGAHIVLLQELFATPYFPITQDARRFALAGSAKDHPVVARFSRLAEELGSCFLLASSSVPIRRSLAPWRSSTLTVISSASIARATSPTLMAIGRSTTSHPATPAFACGTTAFGRIGVGICWDQWFPECARAMALKGAEVLLCPTAIGSDPPTPNADSRSAWQTVQQAHAVANAMPVVAANRIGVETAEDGEDSIDFYGSSFIVAESGELLAEASRDCAEVITATVDLDGARRHREFWTYFRDRRPELYTSLLTFDGEG